MLVHCSGAINPLFAVPTISDTDDLQGSKRGGYISYIGNLVSDHFLSIKAISGQISLPFSKCAIKDSQTKWMGRAARDRQFIGLMGVKCGANWTLLLMQFICVALRFRAFDQHRDFWFAPIHMCNFFPSISDPSSSSDSSSSSEIGLDDSGFVNVLDTSNESATGIRVATRIPVRIADDEAVVGFESQQATAADFQGEEKCCLFVNDFKKLAYIRSPSLNVSF